jgi:hypothetical protein
MVKTPIDDNPYGPCNQSDTRECVQPYDAPVQSLTQALCALSANFGSDEEGSMSRPFGVALLVAGRAGTFLTLVIRTLHHVILQPKHQMMTASMFPLLSLPGVRLVTK